MTAMEGKTFGQYRLLDRIGRGGMGEVFLAERADAQYQQRVAIKLLRPGFYGAGPDEVEMISRFERERQILARLEHPHIATLLDGGMADDGRPYLVMQYVRGEPITTYCDRLRLSIEERLKIFATVCRAVQFSHANLVVHRDLKPSNILMTTAGEPKLFDFGIAKLLESDGATADATRADLRIMTPERAAPEQLSGEPVTAAVDVYGLGILLCELLCGRTPHRFSSRDALTIARELDSRPPTSPSALIRPGSDAQLMSDEPTTQTLSQLRGCSPERLRRRLAGDLDQIVLMALRREPERRYLSAAQLAEDVERYLSDEPVIAHRDSRSYRARKFLERHRLGTTAAASFLILVLGFGIVTAFQSSRVRAQRDRANAERDRAEAVVRLLTGLFETADPVKDPGRDRIAITELLERGEQSLEGLQDQPGTRARMLLVLGQINAQRTRYDKARELLEQAADGYRRTTAAPDATSLAIDYQLARVIRAQGDLAAARQALADSLANHRQVHGTQHEKTAEVMTDLATVAPIGERRALLEEALAIRRALLDPMDPAIASSLDGLATYHKRFEELDLARDLYQEALDIMRVARGERHPHTLIVLNNLANVLEDPDEKIATLERVLELHQEILPDSTNIAFAHSNLGVAQLRAGRRVEARQALETAVALLIEHFGADHWQVGNTMLSLGALEELEERYSEAFDHFDRALTLSQAAGSADDIRTGLIISQRSQVLARLGRLEEARRGAEQAVEKVRQAAPDTKHLAATLLRQGRVLLAAGSAPEAELAFREALKIARTLWDPSAPQLAEIRAGLGLTLIALGQSDAARQLLVEAEARLKGWPMTDPFELRQLQSALERGL